MIRKYLHWIIPPIILTAAALYVLAVSLQVRSPEQTPPIAVEVMSPWRGDWQRSLRFSGHIETENLVTIIPLVSGSLYELHVETGDKVQAGELLARIDPSRYELQLKQAETGYQAAASNWERVKLMYESGATSRQNYEQSRAHYDASRTQYELALLQRGYAEITSPLDGVVLSRHLNRGDIASSERPLLSIGDLENLSVKIRVPERHYQLFLERSGDMEGRLRGSEGHWHPARLTRIAPFIAPQSRTFEAVFGIEDGNGRLRPGMFVELELVTASWSAAPALPFEAQGPGGRLWYLEEDSGQDLPTARYLEYAPASRDRADGVFILPEELSSLVFIVEGMSFLYPGAVVRPIERETGP